MSEQQQRSTKTSSSTATLTPPANMNNAIDLMELMYRFLASWKLIVILALVLAIVFGIRTVYFVTPMYEATSTIYVVSRSDSVVNMSDLQLGSALTQDYIKVFKMWEVHEHVIQSLNLPYSYGQMRSMLRVTNEQNTRMIDITVTSSDPNEAAAIANEYARIGSQYIADTMSTVKPNIMSVARVPANPVNLNKTRSIMSGFMLGAVIACGYVTLMYLFDDKYKTAEDIRKYTGLTTLAVVPVEPVENKKSSRRHS